MIDSRISSRYDAGMPTIKTQDVPQQERSRRTTRKIIDATIRLLATRPFEEIPVADIARAARVSVGGFYARFPSKEALLDWFDENLLQEELKRRESGWRKKGTDSRSLEEIIEQTVAHAAHFFARHRQLLSRIALSLRSGANPESLKRARHFNERIHGMFLAAALKHRRRIGHPDPEFALRLGITAVSAALREEILFGDRRLEAVYIGEKRLVRELTDLFVAYLRLSP